jgi:peptidoglycan/xylan/chitin deacetylase (PgdA/CDA1 family)
MEDVSRRLVSDGFVIFLFHGVVRSNRYEVRNYTRKHLPVDEFSSVLHQLKGAGAPVSLDQVLAAGRGEARLPSNAFAVTFDDGFENNYSVAAPLLADMQIPATFYVSTAMVQDNSMSWIDRIEYCLEGMARGELRFPWRPDVMSFSTAHEKIAILDHLRGHIKSTTAIAPDEIADLVFDQCGIEPVSSSQDPLDLKLSWRQVRQLNDQELFTVGGHSHEHLNLAFLSEPEMSRQIDTSLDLLKRMARVGPRHYSYPEGLEHCYSSAVIAKLRSAGVSCCPTAIEGVNRVGDDPFHFRRLFVI